MPSMPVPAVTRRVPDGSGRPGLWSGGRPGASCQDAEPSSCEPAGRRPPRLEGSRRGESGPDIIGARRKQRPLHAPLRRVGWCGLVLRRRIGQTAPGAGADDRVPVPGERHALVGDAVDRGRASAAHRTRRRRARGRRGHPAGCWPRESRSLGRTRTRSSPAIGDGAVRCAPGRRRGGYGSAASGIGRRRLPVGQALDLVHDRYAASSAMPGSPAALPAA